MSDLASTNGAVIHRLAQRAPNTVDLRQATLDSLPMMVSVFQVITPTEFRIALMNQAALMSTRSTDVEMLGKQLRELTTPEEAEPFEQQLQQCYQTGIPHHADTFYQLPHGDLWASSRFIPYRDENGTITHIVTVWEDITERKQREQAERERQEATITHQAASLTELSTPLLAISDTTVVMPLIGTVDTRRIQHIMEALLSGVAEQRARSVILDITGVHVVDTQVARAFVQAAKAVSLLGAHTIITGIRPEVAQTLVQLGVDLASIITRSTLQAGIAYAMARERRG